MQIQGSASSQVAEGSRAKFLSAATSPDINYSLSDLQVTLTALPSNGTVLLANGFTPVRLGQVLSLAQLGALKFRPALSGATAVSDFSKAHPAGATADVETRLPASYSVLIVPQDSGARTIGIQISTDTDRSMSDLYAIVTELPLNGAVLLSDGTTTVRRGQTLTAAQLKRLRFRPAGGAVGQISTLNYLVVGPAGSALAGCVLLIVGPVTPALNAPARNKPTSASVVGSSVVASIGLAALLDTYLSSVSSSELTRTDQPVPETGEEDGKKLSPSEVNVEQDMTAAQFAAPASRGTPPPSSIEPDGEETEVLTVSAEAPVRIGSSGLPLATALVSPTVIQNMGSAPLVIRPDATPTEAGLQPSTITPLNFDAGPVASRPMASTVPFPIDSPVATQPPLTPPSSSPTPAPAVPSGGQTPAVIAPPPTVVGGTADGSPNPELDAWSAHWREAALRTPCGSCTGGNCGICSIRIGGPPSSNGQPTGFVPRTVQYYDPSANTVGGANDQSSSSAGTPTPSAESSSTSSLAATAASNPIVLENMLQGTPESEWLIDQHDPSIEGFAAQFSVDNGQRVDFKINTDATRYRIDIYRIGYYGGDGARRVATIERNLATPQVQPVPIFDPARRLVDAGNWSVSASWDVPADAVSGVYFARLERLDGQGGANMIPFIVRDDENPSDITFQTADTTWQAYNWWGGYNLYGGIDQPGRYGRASAVSYNRPIITRDGGFAAGPQDFIFGVEYPAIRWLEQNGYDINYISGIDTARSGAQLLNSEIFLSVGHDEYWSADQRANVEAARDAGVDLAFLGGNNVYWETRWETSIDGTGTPYKTLVSYKERWENANVDVNGTTSTWRDPELGSGNPENALMGTMFTVDSYRLDTMTIPYDLSNFRFWNNTAVDNIQPGQVYSLVPNLLGYEWDSDVDNGFRPDGLINLSSTTVNVEQLLLDYGNTIGPGTATHNLTLYRAPSGALVFGAGTVYWSWGLDPNHDLEPTPTDPNVQQAMVNLFADMGVQPATLMSSLAVAEQTTDNTRPTTTIASPTASGSYTAAQPITITGTATDAGGGIVAVVEVSTDGGTTWHRATGFENWTYTWTPLAGGQYTIRSRAVDDSVNLETPGPGRTITVDPAPVWSLIPQSAVPAELSDSDPGFVNLGVRFTSSQPGTIVGIKYYKGLGDGGTHVGSLWSSTGTLLASATFTGETASGWQTVTFSNPVSISAGTTYVASYRSAGHYASTANYFTGPLTNGPLTAQAGNGYFTYSANNTFPSTPSNGTNYFVDVIFSPVDGPNQPPVAVNDSGFTVTRDTPMTFAASTLLANDTDPNGDILSITGAGSASGGTVSFDSQAQTITFTPNAGYTGPARFGYAVSDGRGGTGSAFVDMTVSPPVTTASLFSSSDTPAILSDPDATQVNLGVRFFSSVNGTVTGIRYYRGANDLGTHTGSLWTSTGTLLASATFTNETASGWQQVNFATPVSITAGTTYVASYHSNGHYAATGNYFQTSRVSGPLTAPAGSNGVYTFGTGNLFPTSTFGATNYWVDVVFSAPATPNQPPVAANDSGFSTAQNTTLDIPASALLANDSDPNGDALTITGVSGAVNGTVSFNSQTNVVSFTPTAGYTGQASFNYSISDGNAGAAAANVALFVNESTTTSFFGSNYTPSLVTVNDPNSVELGFKFQSSSNGEITGMRFYRGPQNTGTHVANLWTSSGSLLASATFTNETSSGWQQVNFATPVSITAGTTYVASYHTNGFYSADPNYFATSHTSGPLTAPSSSSSGGNGVYAYGSSSLFPTNSFNATSYGVDVLFRAQLAA